MTNYLWKLALYNISTAMKDWAPVSIMIMVVVGWRMGSLIQLAAEKRMIWLQYVAYQY